jgi:hypothetical protein
MKRLSVIFVMTAAFALLSCPSPNGGPEGGGATAYQSKKFWAVIYSSNTYYQLTADLVAEGQFCKVYVERGCGVSASTARDMAYIYDTKIYDKNIKAFGSDSMTNTAVFDPATTGVDITTMNTMDFASYLAHGADWDGKLTLLLMNIKTGTSGLAQIAGYFSMRDFSPLEYSNSCDMIYVNAKWAGTEEANQTVAHEMQHLMNYVTSWDLRFDGKSEPALMDLWINEGLSLSAERIYADDKHLEGRINWYLNDPTGLIKEGNNFFIWDNHQNESRDERFKGDEVLDDYATAYLFFQWLRKEANGSFDIFKDIITSTETDYEAVTIAAAKYNGSYADWGKLLGAWMAANWIKDSTYGYDSDLNNALNKVNIDHYVPAKTTKVRLYPGEAVYSYNEIKTVILDSSDPDIKYAKLKRNPSSVDDNPTYGPNDGILLTYNADANLLGGPSYGTTTGVAAKVQTYSMNTVPNSQPALSGPFLISGADMLRRNGYVEEPITLDIAKQLIKRLTKNE